MNFRPNFSGGCHVMRSHPSPSLWWPVTAGAPLYFSEGFLWLWAAESYLEIQTEDKTLKVLVLFKSPTGQPRPEHPADMRKVYIHSAFTALALMEAYGRRAARWGCKISSQTRRAMRVSFVVCRMNVWRFLARSLARPSLRVNGDRP